MAAELIIKTELDRQRLRKVVDCLDLKKPLRFNWRIYKENRSMSQHSLYWMWNGYISNFTGETKEEVHHRNKKEHLVQIFERDNPGYAEMIESIREVYRQGMKKQAEFLFDKTVSMTTTKDMDVHQFTEYLNDVEQGALRNGIVLPRPDDYETAMGRVA